MSYNYDSDSESESVVMGTAFAPLEDDQIVSKKPELDLTVRDAQGRRRFHGAFTGGFSAGHYMTVGSEEGFTPQQFKSNRHEKWDQTLIQRKPENFMDSEDMDVFGIAPKRITTKDKFAEQQEFAGFRKTDSLIDVLKSVVKPSVESIGHKLYKRMKLKARNDSKYSEPKVYGCEVLSNTSANNDFSITLYKPKSDFHGIGYKSIAEESDSNQNHMKGVSAVFKSGRKLEISGEAFGYGVLDEDIEEDAVVYQRDDMSKYDFEIGSVRPERKDKNRDKVKAIDVLKSDVIEGFVKSFSKINLMEILNKKYPKPIVPIHWKRKSMDTKNRKSRWDQTSAQDLPSSSTTSDDKSAPKPPVMNANMRAILLGEEVVHRQGIKKPVLEPISDSTKVSSIGNTDKESVNQNTNESFLNRPLTGFWANKFTRSSDGPEDNSLSGGLTEFKANDKTVGNNDPKEVQKNVTERTTYEWHPHSLLCKRFNIPNPYPQYPDFVGVVTVGKSNVRNRTSKINDKKLKPNIFDCLFDEKVLSNNSKPNDVINENNDIFESDVKSVETYDKIERIGDKEVEETEESLETTRPEMDLFKAIFASDEESDGEDEDIDKNESNQKNAENIVSNSEPQTQSKASDLSCDETLGVFANIDFDLLNRNFNPVLETKQIENSVTNKPEVSESVKQNENNDDLYGPALPPDSALFTSIPVYSAMNSSQTNSKSSKRKKKDKKHKKHKKQKTSHKNKRHRKASTSSSSSSDIDHKIIEHFKKVRK